jgi:hypothetical protein
MTNEFTVIGEHRHDERQLLVLGADGQCYRYLPGRELLSPVEPNEKYWVIFTGSEEALSNQLDADQEALRQAQSG